MMKKLVPVAIVAVGALAAAPSQAQVVLHPNKISGTVHFTNQNPDVVNLLQQIGIDLAQVGATSTSPTGYSSYTNYLTPGSPTSASFELQAESEAGGQAGVTYRLAATAWVYRLPNGQGNGQYWFHPVDNVQLFPSAQQPGGATADIAECVGVVRFHFGADASCSTPVEITAGSIWTSYGFNYLGQGSTGYLLLPGGANVTAPLIYALGTDPTLDTVSYAQSVAMNPACDAIQDICIQVPSASSLGSLAGPYDIVGRAERWPTRISGSEPVNGNYRFVYLSGSPAAQDFAPPSWWELQNLVPGTYGLGSESYVGEGRRLNYLTSTIGANSIPVTAGAVSDGLQTIGGQDRYPLVMTPGFFRGSVRLADPYVKLHPDASSSLSSLYFLPAVDANGDGWPDDGFANQYGVMGSSVRAHDSYYAQSIASFPGTFDPTSGEFGSDYEQVVVHPYDLPASWQQDGLGLFFWSEGTNQNLYYLDGTTVDPATFRHGHLNLAHDTSYHVIGPNDVVTVNHEYCFNEVTMQYQTTNGALYNPSASVQGSFGGVDWQGQATSYSAQGTFYGTPAMGFYRVDGPSVASPFGEVTMSLPQGSYTLQPGGTIVADGASSTGSFQKTDITLGCGQRVNLVPGLAVSLDSLPSCAGSNVAIVSGQVQSGTTAVDHIWYRVNGGSPVDICTSNCGVSPPFSATVPLGACTNTVEVFASSSFVNGVASTSTQIVWDDPLDPGVCPGATCQPTCTTIQRGTFGDVFDTTLAENPSQKNYGSDDALVAGSTARATRMLLLGFDLGAVPEHAQVTAVDLLLTEATNTGGATLTLHDVLTPWGEQAVTFSSFDHAFDPSPLASFDNGGGPFQGGAGRPIHVSSSELVELVQAWVSGEQDNHGILIRELEGSVPRTTFRSSEYSVVGERPALTVCYTVPSSP